MQPPQPPDPQPSLWNIFPTTCLTKFLTLLAESLKMDAWSCCRSIAGIAINPVATRRKAVIVMMAINCFEKLKKIF